MDEFMTASEIQKLIAYLKSIGWTSVQILDLIDYISK